MKLWILDADVVIDLLALDKFDSLAKKCEIYLATTVIDEVQYLNRNGEEIKIDLREEYIEKNLIVELSASVEEQSIFSHDLRRSISSASFSFCSSESLTN